MRMADASVPASETLVRRAWRWAPAIGVLAFTLIVAASVGSINDPPPDSRAVAMVQIGREALGSGNANEAIDAFEAALALDPGFSDALVALADATRAQGLPGKSIGYYRKVLERDPRNVAALSGEGHALVAQGAIDEAERNLALLGSVCGAGCDESQALHLAISQDPQARLAAGDSEDAAPQ